MAEWKRVVNDVVDIDLWKFGGDLVGVDLEVEPSAIVLRIVLGGGESGVSVENCLWRD